MWGRKCTATVTRSNLLSRCSKDVRSISHTRGQCFQSSMFLDTKDNIASTSKQNDSTTTRSSCSLKLISPHSTADRREFSSIASTSSFDTPSDAAGSVQSKSNPLQDMEEIINNSNSGFTLEELKDLALKPCTPLTLGDMYKYASANITSKNYQSQRLRNAQFLYQELPIRMAQRAADLLTLPYGLNKTQSVQEIVHIYLKYLQNFKTFPCPTNEEEELEFTKLLRPMVLDRSSIPEAIARGLYILKDDRTEGLDIQRLQAMEKALYRFFNARIGLRLITEHHILSCKHFQEENKDIRKNQSCIEQQENEDEFGCIQQNCDPTREARIVANQVMDKCRERYGISPEIEIIDCTPEQFVQADFTYVPHHLQYTLQELLKNSCRATMKQYMAGTNNEEDHIHHENSDISTNQSLPSIRVVVAKGAEDVTIKIADKGGGVPRSVIDKMWTFAHSTLSDSIKSKENNDKHFDIDEFTGGRVQGKGFYIRGFGLPLARIYARYFGGELTLKSMEGYGVDAYLYLPMLGKSCENLPKRVLNSPGQGDSIHDKNHHVYQGDRFSLSSEEPWNNSARQYTTDAFNDKLAKVAL